MNHDSEYQMARRAVVRRWRKRALFFAHLAIYILISSTPGAGGGFVIWLPVLVAHFVYTFDLIQHFLDRATQRELKRLQHTPVKLKHVTDQRMRLTDDGELEALDEGADYGDSNASAKTKSKR